MATLQETALRAIYFPFTDPIPGTEIITVTDYLVYLLPFSTSILLYNDITNPTVTRTFKVKEIFLASEILNTDVSSPNYNEHVIEDYVKQGIFSKLPLTVTSGGPGIPGIPPDPALYEVTTEHTIFAQRNNYSGAVTGKPFDRGNYITWLQYYGNDGVVWSIEQYNKFQPLNSVGWDINMPTINTLTPSNVVTDSSDIPWFLNFVPNVDTVNYDVWLSNPAPYLMDNNNRTLNLQDDGSNDHASHIGLVSIAENPNILDSNTAFQMNLLMAEDNTMYFVSAKRVYHIQFGEGPFWTEITGLQAETFVGAGYVYNDAMYDIATQSLILSTTNNTASTYIIKVPLANLADKTISLMSSSGNYLFGVLGNIELLWKLFNNPIKLGMLLNNENTFSTSITKNNNMLFPGFVDWTSESNPGETTYLRYLSLPYDINDTDKNSTFFIVDSLNPPPPV
jgi:hypothetical protein